MSPHAMLPCCVLAIGLFLGACGKPEEQASSAAADKVEEAPSDDARVAEADAEEEAAADDSVALPAEPVHIYVVRHAEKAAKEVSTDPRDPPLTDQGQLRAQDLAAQLGALDIDAIYTTDYQRTRQTIAPLAAAKGISSTVMEPKGIDVVAGDLAALSGQTLVISGHSNTVPDILTALGVEERIELDDDDYGDLFVVTIDHQGSKLERRRFGDGGSEGPSQPVPAAGD